MKVIQNGNSYTIFPNADAILDKLEPKHYEVNFNPFQGYTLLEASPFTKPNHKLYGNVESKVKRIFKRHEFSYSRDQSNTGAICSGKKGSGKSLLIRVAALTAIDKNMPVISINASTPSLNRFINSIDQKCLFILDEFEKSFDEIPQQNELLTVLDGTTNKNGHLFLFAVNDKNGVTEYLFNRPGRTHYHFKYDYLNSDTVREYLADNLKDPKTLDSAFELCKQIDCTFDILQALVYEFNEGFSSEEVKEALNADIKSSFTVVTTLHDNTTHEEYNYSQSGNWLKVKLPRFFVKDEDYSEGGWWQNSTDIAILKEFFTFNEETNSLSLTIDKDDEKLKDLIINRTDDRFWDFIEQNVKSFHIEYGFKYSRYAF